MKKRQRAPLVGAVGLTKIVYIGKRTGTATWWGAVTGQAYKAGGTRRVLLVDNRDLPHALKSWTDKQDGVDIVVFALAPKEPDKKQEVAQAPEENHEKPEDGVSVEADNVYATTGAIELARQHGIDLAGIYDGKKVTRRDVQRHIDSIDNSGAGLL